LRKAPFKCPLLHVKKASSLQHLLAKSELVVLETTEKGRVKLVSYNSVSSMLHSMVDVQALGFIGQHQGHDDGQKYGKSRAGGGLLEESLIFT
jgi:hypothetical protein